LGNGWITDPDDYRQEGYVGVLTKRAPAELAAAYARASYDRRRIADLKRCARYVIDRAEERRSRDKAPGDVSDVADLLDRLDPLAREVIRLRFWEGLRFWQIARRLTIPTSTIFVWYNKALATMRA
jgi:DNA-directed RNA polymerase specialized sigma24 family protein